MLNEYNVMLSELQSLTLAESFKDKYTPFSQTRENLGTGHMALGGDS
jgi:hypothetical protein